MKTYRVSFKFNPYLADTIKKIWGAKWDKESKSWLVTVPEKNAEYWPKWCEWATKKYDIEVKELS